MTPVMQTALIGLVWALSVSIVMFAAGCLQSPITRKETVSEERKEPALSIVYLCDGGCECGSSSNCYMNGGFCSHTVDIAHAVNFEQMLLPTGAGLNMYVETNSKERTHDN